MVSKEAVNGDFDSWKTNFEQKPEVQEAVYNSLSKNKAINTDFNTWSTNLGLK